MRTRFLVWVAGCVVGRLVSRDDTHRSQIMKGPWDIWEEVSGGQLVEYKTQSRKKSVLLRAV